MPSGQPVASLYALVGADGTEFEQKLTAYDTRLKKVASQPAAKFKLDADTSLVEAGLGRVGTFLDAGRTKFREFGRAGSELATVAAVLGGEFGAAGGAVGEFSRILADTLLVGHAIVDLGPGILSAAANAIGLGTASTAAAGGISAEGAAAAAAAPQLDALAAAEGTATAAAGGTSVGLVGIAAAAVGVVLPLALVAGGMYAVVYAGTQTHTTYTAMTQDQQNAANAAEMYGRQLRILNQDHASGALSDERYRSELAKLNDEYPDAISGASAAAGASSKFNGVLNGTSQQAGPASDAIALFGSKAYDAAKGSYEANYQIQAMEASQAKIGPGAYGAATAQDRFATAAANAGNWALNAAGKFLTLAAAEAAWNKGKATAQDSGLAGGMEFKPGLFGPGGMSSGEYYLYQLNKPQYQPPPVKTGGGGSSAASTAKQDAAAALQAWKDAENAKLAAAHDAGSKYLAYVHDSNLTRIASDRDAAQKSIEATHTASLKYIEDRRNEINVDYQRAHDALYEGVTKDRAALSAREQAQQLRNQQESVQDAQKALTDAQASGDQARIDQATRSLRNANESLQNMQDAAVIDKEQAAADANAKALDTQHEADLKALDAAKQAADEKYQAAKSAEDDRYNLQVEQENRRYDDQLAAYDNQYQALVDHLKKMKAIEAVAALESFDTRGNKMGENLTAAQKAAAQAAADKIGADATAVSAYLDSTSPSAAAAHSLVKTGIAANLGPEVAAPAEVNVSVSITGALVFDPQGLAAKQLADAIEPMMLRAFRAQGATTDTAGSDNHSHRLGS